MTRRNPSRGRRTQQRAAERAELNTKRGPASRMQVDRTHAGLGIPCGPCGGPCRIDEATDG